MTAGRGSAIARAIVLALAVAWCQGAATAASPEEISGKWAGPFVNSKGTKGIDKLEIVVHADRTVTGTWDGKKIENGEVVTDTLLQWEAWTPGKDRRYCARCLVKDGGKVLEIDYTLTTRDPQGKLTGGYTGTSKLQKK
jgi:hypothetical protein